MGKYRIVLISWICFLSIPIWATHNRAGEITIKQTGDLTLEVTVTTYTKTSSIQADRDSVLVFWGDGSAQYVYRINGNGQPLTNDRKLNYYVGTHTYPGRATYTISMQDPNRNGGILNVNHPNSEAIPFYIEASYTFLNPQFQGYNNSATLLQPPIDFACVGKRYIHNPNAYDIDGDSLAYELIIPLQDSGMNVPNYVHPSQIIPGPNNIMTLDPITGDLIWDAPRSQGEYNIAFRVKEYRNGVLISSFIRDMQILVLLCDNTPPEINAIEEVCVIAGEELILNISVSDPDAGQLVKVTASGGPFEQAINKAILEAGPGGFQSPPITAQVIWSPGCDQVREQPYTVIIKATDNFHDTTGLVDLHAIHIRVIAPPALNLTSSINGNNVQLHWESPYTCESTLDNYFKGFSVWRMDGSNQFVPDTCETGLNGRGYTRIANNLMNIEGDTYIFTDSDVRDGVQYCYRVLAEFARTTPGGQPYLRVVSQPSEETCIRSRADLPLLKNVSVLETNADGKMAVAWIKPDGEVLDTIQFPGPYRYRLLYAEGLNGTSFIPVPGGEFAAPTFQELKTDTFTIENIDTRIAYNFRLEFYTGDIGTLYGNAPDASSIFLSVNPSHEINQLSWEEVTPWDNYEYQIWRSDAGGSFSLIATTEETSYEDRNLINGAEYCYQITALGTYGLTGLPEPLINNSQESCGIPHDNIPPCPPELHVSNGCNEAEPGTNPEELYNTISWMSPCGVSDIAYYIIYYSMGTGEMWNEIARPDAMETILNHFPGTTIAGCYYIVAVDLNGNSSESSSVVCVQNCPVYKLPNTFTPNGDGQNDVYKPIMNLFIDRVKMQIFNRWGQLVFETTDPQINWDGRNQSGTVLSDGVYFYICEAYEFEAIAPIRLSGFIELIKG